MEEFLKFKQPYNVNVARASRPREPSQAEQTRRSSAKKDRAAHCTRCSRRRGARGGSGSQANFILCRVLGRGAHDLKLALERRGILVRHYAKRGLENCIRISVGRPEHTDALIHALGDLT